MLRVFRSSPSAVNLAAAAAAAALVVRQVETKYSALLFKQQLTAYVEKIYEIIRDNLKKELGSLLSLCSRGLHLNAFFKYLFADINPPINPKRGIHHDMNEPLSHYFIYTGHNSYLTGNQLSSDCSDVPIIQALHQGVRVIELDIWPNSAKDYVEVLHGGTLTTPVALIKCLRSIKEHAFTVSEYPVVVTLEDHLTPDLQAKVAEMITQTFGDMLFSPDSCLKDFPSPESLKRRVLISTKPPKEYLQAKEVKEKDSKKGTDSPDSEAWGREVSDLKARYNDKDDSDEGAGEEDDGSDEGDPNSQQMSHQNTYAGKGKGGLSDWLRVDPDKVRRLSLSEQELGKAVVTHGKEIIRFTQRNLLRIYPKGIRFDSSNYPFVAWTHGAQMVAFNMQGYGKSLWLMHGMFRSNGGCGYVKKPDILLKADRNCRSSRR